MAKKKEAETVQALILEGDVTNVGYDRSVRTVLYVHVEQAEAFGTTVRLAPVGTIHESYDVARRQELLGKRVRYSYDRVDYIDQKYVVINPQFIEFVE